MGHIPSLVDDEDDLGLHDRTSAPRHNERMMSELLRRDEEERLRAEQRERELPRLPRPPPPPNSSYHLRRAADSGSGNSSSSPIQPHHNPFVRRKRKQQLKLGEESEPPPDYDPDSFLPSICRCSQNGLHLVRLSALASHQGEEQLDLASSSSDSDLFLDGNAFSRVCRIPEHRPLQILAADRVSPAWSKMDATYISVYDLTKAKALRRKLGYHLGTIVGVETFVRDQGWSSPRAVSVDYFGTLNVFDVDSCEKLMGFSRKIPWVGGLTLMDRGYAEVTAYVSGDSGTGVLFEFDLEKAIFVKQWGELWSRVANEANPHPAGSLVGDLERRRLFAASPDGSAGIRILELDDGGMSQFFPADNSTRVRVLHLLDEGGLLVGAGTDSLAIWDLRKFDSVPMALFDDVARKNVISLDHLDSEKVVSTTQEGASCVWSAVTGKILASAWRNVRGGAGRAYDCCTVREHEWNCGESRTGEELVSLLSVLGWESDALVTFFVNLTPSTLPLSRGIVVLREN